MPDALELALAVAALLTGAATVGALIVGVTA